MGQSPFYKERVCLNRIPYVEKVQLNGSNAAISNSAETIWLPGATYAQLTSAVAMEAVSSSANDAAAGTGARTVFVEGLDTNWDSQTETVTLNGATPVALSRNYLAINKLYVVTAGSGLTNAGNVDIRTVSGSVVKRRLSTGPGLGLGRSADFIYTIPRKSVGLLSAVWIDVEDATDDVTAFLLTKDSSGIIRGEGECTLDFAMNVTKAMIDFQDGLLIPEKTLVELRAITDAGAGKLVGSAQLLVFDAVNYGFV